MFKRLRVSTKIVIPIFIILLISNIITNYITASKMDILVKNSAKNSLGMLTDSLFITLRNAMNTGDPAVIKQAEDNSRKNIKGLSKLTVAKSRGTLELYSPEIKCTTDKDILKVFSTKKEQVIEFYEKDSHFFRVLRPMVATQECIMCHANQKVGDVIGVIDLAFSLDNADETINEALIFILITALIFILITAVTVWLVAKKTTQPLVELQEEFKIFFAFLSHEKDYIKPFKIHYMDEIGEIVESLNINIEKLTKGLEQDKEAIMQTALKCKDASIGNLDVNISVIASNPEINNLTQIINNLLSSLNNNIDITLNTLDNYSRDNYDKRINSNNDTQGSIKKLFSQVNFLGETLTKLSTQNLKNGKALQQTSHVFSKNVKMLADSSHEQESSLSQATNSLNDITDNIQNTSQSSKQMSQLALQVHKSSDDGRVLASKTSQSIDNINSKVNAITEAISMINQIAFQTNILSLNAAVEAATAGEVGKGFAVVAQEVRNLASRSAEASKTIEELIIQAATESKKGSDIAEEMMEGYNLLNENIDSTIQLINSVTEDTNNQMLKIENINDIIVNLDKQTQENARVAQETNIVALQASDIASKIVSDATQKEFIGKENIKIRKKIIDPNFTGIERRKIEADIKKVNKDYG